MDKKTKLAISLMVIGAVGSSFFGYWYYKKLKEQQEADRLLAEGEADMTKNYNQDDRPRLTRLRNAEVNKIYPQDYNKRSRFAVYDSNFNKVDDRFKIMETHTQEKRQTTGRMRTSGDRGAYNKSYGSNARLQQRNQNPTLKDLSVW